MSAPFTIGIRGLGVCAAGGLNLRDVVASIKRERTSLGPVKRNTFILGEFMGGEVPLECPVEDRAREILMRALQPALDAAALTAREKLRTGVFLGSTGGFISRSEFDTHRKWKTLGTEVNFANELTARGVGEVAYEAARVAGTGGPVLSYSIACTSSAFGMLEAWRFIKAGVIDHAIVIGFESLLNTTLHGFKSLMLYDPVAHRPFDKNRKGLQLGEGCGVLVLSREVGTRFTMIGGANRNDHSNITGMETGGSSVVKLLQETLEASGCGKDEIVAIKAHGTGTLDNDLGEGVGFARFFGQVPRFCSLKGYLGHTLGGAGAIEVATWLGCLEAGFIPRSIGFETIDEQIGIAPTKEAFAGVPGNYLFTFFGFGGSSVGLVIRDGERHV